MANPEIKFGSRKVEADVRELYDMKEVIFDKRWLRDADNVPLYYMYRDLYRSEHKETIRENNLRFDITVIPPRLLGKEYVKTKGHYHSKAYKNISYPEIYSVMQGKAHYLLQKTEGDKVKNVVVVEAEKGDKVVIPPNYGHITINPTSKTLKMANWISPDQESSYEEITNNGGGCYFETGDGFIKNNKYDKVPSIDHVKPKKVPDLNINSKKPLYNLIEEPSCLRFLNHPEKFGWLFDKALK